MSHRRLNLHRMICLVSAKFQTISMYICVCLMWNNVSFEHAYIVFYVHRNLVAFHPRPQIASDLGRNVTRNFNPHRNRNQFPSGNEILAYGRRFKSQPASTRCDLRIASPTRPFLQVI